jgi:dihydroorotate dehydrogenase
METVKEKSIKFKLIDERNKIRKNLPILVKIAPDLSDDELKDISIILTRENVCPIFF